MLPSYFDTGTFVSGSSLYTFSTCSRSLHIWRNIRACLSQRLINRCSDVLWIRFGCACHLHVPRENTSSRIVLLLCPCERACRDHVTTTLK